MALAPHFRVQLALEKTVFLFSTGSLIDRLNSKLQPDPSSQLYQVPVLAPAFVQKDVIECNIFHLMYFNLYWDK